MTYEGVPPIAAREMRDGSYYEAYNSALALTDSGREIYHKSRLVTGVEQIPFLGSLPFLKSLALSLGGASGTLGTQEERSVMKVDSIAIAPIICYESDYGEYVTEFVLNGANILSIITNDAWWGDTPGHQQHFHYARLRAVENRRSIIRSANTGISGVIDPYGKVQASLPYGVDGRIDEEVQLYSNLTFFTKYGDVLGRLCLLLVVYLFLVSKVKKYQRIRLDS
jgi:apolipoprotein N-acyltransferase